MFNYYTFLTNLKLATSFDEELHVLTTRYDEPKVEVPIWYLDCPPDDAEPEVQKIALSLS